jgi:hypothetical protein
MFDLEDDGDSTVVSIGCEPFVLLLASAHCLDKSLECDRVGEGFFIRLSGLVELSAVVIKTLELFGNPHSRVHGAELAHVNKKVFSLHV